MQVLIAKCPDSVQIPEDGVLAPHSSSSTPLRTSSGQVKKVILRLLQAHPESLTGGTKSHQVPPFCPTYQIENPFWMKRGS